MADNVNNNWKLNQNNIYEVVLPKIITVNYTSKLATSIINDYISRNKTFNPSILILINETNVEIFDANSLKITNHLMLQYPKTKIAAYNEPNIILHSRNNYFKDYSMASNNKVFQSRDEAISWLLYKN